MQLIITPYLYKNVITHLLPPQGGPEQAAFLFSKSVNSNLIVEDCYLMTEYDFVRQAIDYLELKDQTRMMLIKKAHDMNASLIEMHSHPGPWQAMFSVADRIGLHETVPHMKWRLPNRPYGAIVVATGSFDALIWQAGHKTPIALDSLIIGEKILKPTNLSNGGWK